MDVPNSSPSEDQAFDAKSITDAGGISDPDAHRGDFSTVSMVQPPTSLYGLVSDAHAIVIGTIEAIEREQVEGPYSIYIPPGSDQLDPMPPPDAWLVGFTYFRVRVDRLLLADGELREGESFLLRIDGMASKSEGTYGNLMPFPKIGSTSVYVLGINPDGASYGIRGPWGRIIVEESGVRYGDWGDSDVSVPSSEGLTGEEFLMELEGTIREVQIERQQ